MSRRNECSIIAGPNQYGVAVLVPAFPAPCDYVQIVEFNQDHSQVRELVYWDFAEWQEDDDDRSCMGAIMGAVKQVCLGAAFTRDRQAHAVHCEWEEW